MKKFLKYTGLLGALNLIVAPLTLLILSGCAEEVTEQKSVIPRVKYYVVGESATGQSRRLSGKVVAAESSPLSFRVNGTVDEVLVRQGDEVNKGQVLAKIQDRDLQIAVRQARAAVNIARAEVAEAAQSYERAKRLFDQDAGSQAEVEKGSAARATASGNLVSAQSQLEQANRDAASAVLSAPFAGTIASRSIEPFSEVTIGTEAFVLQSGGAVEIDVLVPEALVRDLDHGQAVGISFPTLPDVSLNGSVNEIGSRTVAGNAFPVSIQLNSTDQDLRPGMSAAVTFNFAQYLGDKQAYLVPLSALAIEAGMLNAYREGRELGAEMSSRTAPVFIINRDNELELREISVGDLRGNDLEVFSGLSAGEKVVSAGVAFLREGMKVKLWVAEDGLNDG